MTQKVKNKNIKKERDAMAGEGAPRPTSHESGEAGGENLQDLREKLKTFLRECGDSMKAEIAKKDKFKDITEDKIDSLSDDDLKELNSVVEECLSNSAEAFEKQSVEKLMSLSFAAFFGVLENYERDHPDAPKLQGYSRKAVEEFVKACLDQPGAGSRDFLELVERLDIQQKTVDSVKKQRAGGNGNTGGSNQGNGETGGNGNGNGGGNGETGGNGNGSGSGNGNGETGGNGNGSGENGENGADALEAKKKERIKQIIDNLFGSEDKVRPGVIAFGDGAAFDDPSAWLDRSQVEEELWIWLSVFKEEDRFNTYADKAEEGLKRRKEIIDDINSRFSVKQIKKVLKEDNLTTYTDLDLSELEQLVTKLEKEGNSPERKKKKKRGNLLTKVGALFATALIMVTQNGCSKEDVKKAPTGPDTQIVETVEYDDANSDMPDLEAAEVERDVGGAETQEGTWDAAHGGDARGLWASLSGENDNPDKEGPHDLVAASEFADYLQEGKLDTEEGQQEFKDHLVDVASREGVIMEQMADYAQKHGDLDFLPESIRGLKGEELEDAIKENRGGCYDELVKNLQEKLASGKVSVDKLQPGMYTNYYAKMTNPNELATIDNLELETTTTWENGSPVFRLSFADGSVWLLKGKCIQLVELIPSEEVVVTTTTPIVVTMPGETTTTTTTTSTTETSTTPVTSTTPATTTTTTPTTTETTPATTTAPTTTETMPATTTTPETTTTPTTTTADNSKHEEALAAGQGTDVRPVEEGARIDEDATQEPYVYNFTAPVSPEAQNADQTFIEYNFADEMGEEAARRREAAAQEQQAIDAQRGREDAAPVDLDTLGGSGF